MGEWGNGGRARERVFASGFAEPSRARPEKARTRRVGPGQPSWAWTDHIDHIDSIEWERLGATGPISDTLVCLHLRV
jgi:hypothetical protein